MAAPLLPNSIHQDDNRTDVLAGDNDDMVTNMNMTKKGVGPAEVRVVHDEMCSQ